MTPPEQQAQKQQKAFRPWLPGKHQDTASKEATAIQLYNVWNDHYEPEKERFEDVTYEDVGDVVDLMMDYGVLLTAHPPFEGWHKPKRNGTFEDQLCPKRLSVEYVMNLYQALFEQLQSRFPQHPLLKGNNQVWWKNQLKRVRQEMEKELKRNPACC